MNQIEQQPGRGKTVEGRLRDARDLAETERRAAELSRVLAGAMFEVGFDDSDAPANPGTIATFLELRKKRQDSLVAEA